MLGYALVVLLFANSVADLPPGAVMRLGDARWRAGGEVRHLQFSADGESLSAWVAEPNGRLRPIAWNTATGFPVAPSINRMPPDLPDGTTPAVRLKDDRVLTAGPGNAGRVWDATTARQLARLTGHTGSVTAVAVTADGKLLATGSADGLVRVWDAETFRPISEPRGHAGIVRSIRVSVDGGRVVTTDGDTARVWDMTSGKELRSFPATGTVELTPDGLGVILPVGGATIVRDILTGMEIVPASLPARPLPTAAELLARWGLCFAASPDGRKTAVVYPDGTIILHEAATMEPRTAFPGHGTLRHAIAFTPDGTKLLTAGDDHTVLVWDMRLQAMPLPEAVRRETNAAKLWATMCVGKADKAFLAMARLAAEPDAAVQTARMRLRADQKSDGETEAVKLADSRAIELLESLGTPEARAFLKELAGGHAEAFRTQEAKRALERLGK